MLEAVYSILAFVIMILALIYLLLITVFTVKKSYNEVASIKAQLVFTTVLFILIVFKIPIAVILAKSLGMDVFCAVLWAICTLLHVIRFKEEKEKNLKEKKPEVEKYFL